MNFSLVSVIIPVYNVQEYIVECLNSVIEQTYSPLEIIIVDDCSSDESISRAISVLQKSERSWEIIRHDQNKGLSAARNTGIQAASGKYFYLLDSDDFIPRNCIELLYHIAEQENAEQVCGNYIKYSNTNLIPAYATRRETDTLLADPLKAYAMDCAAHMATNKLIQREWYNYTGVRFIDGILHEDEIWSFSLAFRTTKIAYSNIITYYYRMRQGSIMKTNVFSARSNDSRLKIIQLMREEIVSCTLPLPDWLYVWYNDILWRLAYSFHQAGVPDATDLEKSILRHSYLPRLGMIWQLPLTEQKFYFFLNKFFSSDCAHLLACRLNGLFNKIMGLFSAKK